MFLIYLLHLKQTLKTSKSSHSMHQLLYKSLYYSYKYALLYTSAWVSKISITNLKQYNTFSYSISTFV